MAVQVLLRVLSAEAWATLIAGAMQVAATLGALFLAYTLGLRQNKQHTLQEQRVMMVTTIDKHLGDLALNLREWAQASNKRRGELAPVLAVKMNDLWDAYRSSILILDFEIRLSVASVMAGYLSSFPRSYIPSSILTAEDSEKQVTPEETLRWIEEDFQEDLQTFRLEAQKVLGTGESRLRKLLR